MRLGQIKWNNQVIAAVFEGPGMARPIPEYTLYDIIRIAEMEKSPLAAVVTRLAAVHSEQAVPLLPSTLR